MDYQTLRLNIESIHEPWSIDCSAIQELSSRYGIDSRCYVIRDMRFEDVWGLYVDDDGGDELYVMNYHIYDNTGTLYYYWYWGGANTSSGERYFSVNVRTAIEINRLLEAKVLVLGKDSCGWIYVADNVAGDLVEYMRRSSRVFKHSGAIEEYLICGKVRIFGDKIGIARGIFTDDDGFIYTGVIAVAKDVVLVEVDEMEYLAGVDGVVGVFVRA